MPRRVGINGFGRIGRCTFKQLIEDDRFEVVAVNDLAEVDELAYLLKYDSVHGWHPRKVSAAGPNLVVDEQEIRFSNQREPTRLRWGELGVDVVIEASGPSVPVRMPAVTSLPGRSGSLSLRPPTTSTPPSSSA